MIVESLYPTDEYRYVGHTTNQYTEEFTDNISNYVEDPSSYWLGWISYDNLPLPYHLSAGYRKYNEETESYDYIFEDITEKNNFPCGYAQTPSSQYGTPTHMAWIDTDGSKTYYGNGKFCNQIHPQYSGLLETSYDSYNVTCSINLSYVLYNQNAEIVYPTNWYNYLPTTSISFQSNKVSNFYNFLYNDVPFELKITYNNTEYSFNIKYSDFEGHTAILWDTTQSYQIRVFISSYLIGNGCGYNGGSYAYVNSTFMTKVNGTYTSGQTPIANEALLLGGGVTESFQNVYTMSQYSENSPFIMIGRGDSVFPASVVDSISRGVTKVHYDGTMYAVHNTGDCLFYRGTPIESIKKHFSLFYRVAFTFTDGYIANIVYATDVNSNNEFLAKLKTGNLSDERFKNGLREWQYSDDGIQDDEFTEDDVPPYSPEPEPGDDDDPGSDEPIDTPLMTGDDQELQLDRTLTTPNDFITMYNITPVMLSIFGRRLWKSLVDYDPSDPTSVEIYKNFFAILNEEVTGTLDIGAILQFIISVRQYPFDVSNIGITTSVGNTIKIGTGKVGISLGGAGDVQRLTSTIGLIDCGSITIADYKDFKLYNDFRDYLNATVTAFLPYCGSVELNPIEVIHNTVSCYYAIDFYTGECTAYITTTDGEHTVLSAIKNGSIGVLIPITATNSGQISARHMSDNAKDAGLIVSNLGNLFGLVANGVQGNLSGAASNVMGIIESGIQQQQMQAERQGRSAVLAPSLSGGSGAAAFYQPACPSIVVRRGTYARAKIKNYPSSCAYPATTSGVLSSFSGYTECYNVDVSGINCTEEEKEAIKAILETGCYL